MIILDVREKEEFEAEHVPESVLCPLSQFELMAPGILRNLKNEEVLIMCRSGNRARLAMNELKKFPSDHLRFSVYDGGIIRWKQEGKPVRGKGQVFPVMRQVQIFASTMIFLAFLGWNFVNPGFIYLALFVGGGLALAGWTGFCPAAFLLQKMPWNNRKSLSADSPTAGCCN